MKAELRALSKDNAEYVSRHLAAAGLFRESDPELAFAHAETAVRSAGRVGAVREALGLTAYALERYELAGRELRTHRRITGRDDHLPVIADCERGRGRPEKALELYEESRELQLTPAVRTELTIVAAGAHMDSGDPASARRLLEREDFRQPASPALVRLLSAYADVLETAGDPDAGRWEELARRTAGAIGTQYGDDVDPNEDIEFLEVEEELQGNAEDGGEAPDDAGSGDAR